MNLDLRLPVGILFAILALILGAYGALAPRNGPAVDFGYSVNLVWGGIMGIFGLAMWLGAAAAKRKNSR